VTHIQEGKHHWNKFGPWYCDTCGQAIKGEVLENGEVEIEVLEDTKQLTEERSVVPTATITMNILVRSTISAIR
jgi:hypothetical protein